MNYPLDKYRFVTAGNKVIAISSYAGRTVRGVAICSPEDVFSLEKGKELAAARCAYKIAQKRCRRARSQMDKAEALYNQANARFDNMCEYYDDAIDSMYVAEEHLEDLLDSM